MKKFFYLSLLAWCFITVTSAQEQTDIDYTKPYLDHQKKYIITIEPLQWFNWCLRLNFETRLGNGPGWIQISPTVYYPIPVENKNNPDYYYDMEGKHHYSEYDDFSCGFNFDIREPYSHIQGAGLEVNYKRFINPAQTLYLSGGLSYSCLSIDYWGRQWNHYIEDGLDYYGYISDYQTQQLNRLGISIYTGYQVPFRGSFVLDFFIGVGYRYVFNDKNKPKFNESMISYGYTGLTFLTGVRLGVGFK